ncbi:DUF3460 family protein [Candidatus Kinetoplastidibacterium desouzai]|nr:DUF3460 family protein [Candidatus Kinetoplastibacterium desouzaii]
MANIYESEITVFLNAFKKAHPEIELKQKIGRSILWDKSIDLVLKKDFDSVRIPQKSYVYQTD